MAQTDMPGTAPTLSTRTTAHMLTNRGDCTRLRDAQTESMIGTEAVIGRTEMITVTGTTPESTTDIVMMMHGQMPSGWLLTITATVQPMGISMMGRGMMGRVMMGRCMMGRGKPSMGCPGAQLLQRNFKAVTGDTHCLVCYLMW